MSHPQDLAHPPPLASQPDLNQVVAVASGDGVLAGPSIGRRDPDAFDPRPRHQQRASEPRAQQEPVWRHSGPRQDWSEPVHVEHDTIVAPGSHPRHRSETLPLDGRSPRCWSRPVRGSAAGALETYVYTLTWAHGEAAAAIKDWHAAQAATKQARDAYAKYQQAGGTDPFTDPGEPARAAARQRLHSARTQLKSAAGNAATKVKGFRDKAPEKPGVWSKVGDFFSDVGAGLQNAGGHVVNGLASLGNAAANHPGDLLTAAAGAGLMIVGAAGDAGGLVLDATGVGAVLGVPVNVVSTAAIVTGGATVAGGVGDLVMHATSDDQSSPARTDHTGSTAARDVHGVDRTGMRDVDEQHVWDNGDMYVQDDGCIVKVLDNGNGNGNGTYDVVVRDMSNPSGKPVTSIKDATENYINNKVNSGSGHRITMLTTQASALAALLKICSRKKPSARPVRTAISAATQTPSRPTRTARGRSPRRNRHSETARAPRIATPAPIQIERPPASQPATKPIAGTVASSAARRPPSRSASDSGSVTAPPRRRVRQA
jgi:type VII secretion system ESX-1 substrate